ncbi:hypothetical protein CEUSTIGMA_g8560.t1 [Chlamydomonas eustigma]|uniref:Uncharacterized protein n=1 Tax=Chlamydomonas eustigma TaxID=1157962 RepID=A0A250XDJ1_9CHLO|nr:hypothetical protein CEUSTIGMA_g8560.t1 [Chlamydomonas eustigma]|eukprot:GAX81126.1 hypothetical protein CEUSTIGMA_g8560.t1 [Chlamydomonas eustigma]
MGLLYDIQTVWFHATDTIQDNIPSKSLQFVAKVAFQAASVWAVCSVICIASFLLSGILAASMVCCFLSGIFLVGVCATAGCVAWCSAWLLLWGWMTAKLLQSMKDAATVVLNRRILSSVKIPSKGSSKTPKSAPFTAATVNNVNASSPIPLTGMESKSPISPIQMNDPPSGGDSLELGVKTPVVPYTLVQSPCKAGTEAQEVQSDSGSKADQLIQRAHDLMKLRSQLDVEINSINLQSGLHSEPCVLKQGLRGFELQTPRSPLPAQSHSVWPHDNVLSMPPPTHYNEKGMNVQTYHNSSPARSSHHVFKGLGCTATHPLPLGEIGPHHGPSLSDDGSGQLGSKTMTDAACVQDSVISEREISLGL